MLKDAAAFMMGPFLRTRSAGYLILRSPSTRLSEGGVRSGMRWYERTRADRALSKSSDVTPSAASGPAPGAVAGGAKAWGWTLHALKTAHAKATHRLCKENRSIAKFLRATLWSG